METPPVILRRLAERLRGRRLELALTLKELAARAGVSQRFLVSVEAGLDNWLVAGWRRWMWMLKKFY